MGCPIAKMGPAQRNPVRLLVVLGLYGAEHAPRLRGLVRPAQVGITLVTQVQAGEEQRGIRGARRGIPASYSPSAVVRLLCAAAAGAGAASDETAGDLQRSADVGSPHDGPRHAGVLCAAWIGAIRIPTATLWWRYVCAGRLYDALKGQYSKP